MVTDKEIVDALRSMNDYKAPGSDGFNTFFFKKTWHIIGQDVIRAVKLFFQQGYMPRALNCTNITLIPKVSSPTSASQFRPIACCNTLYKLVAKILMFRLQRGIGSVINQAQDGLIPDRQLIENVLLATELVKGYGRGYMSPRCMIKINLKKAYDSIE